MSSRTRTPPRVAIDTDDADCGCKLLSRRESQACVTGPDPRATGTGSEDVVRCHRHHPGIGEFYGPRPSPP